MNENRNWWVSWYSTTEMGPWELKSPWWRSGEHVITPPLTPAGAPIRHVDRLTICAAIRAITKTDAMRKVAAAYELHIGDPLLQIEWRFVNQREDNWEPFNDRFPRADWMKWP